jgi:hypothetical protein
MAEPAGTAAADALLPLLDHAARRNLAADLGPTAGTVIAEFVAELRLGYETLSAPRHRGRRCGCGMPRTGCSAPRARSAPPAGRGDGGAAGGHPRGDGRVRLARTVLEIAAQTLRSPRTRGRMAARFRLLAMACAGEGAALLRSATADRSAP